MKKKIYEDYYDNFLDLKEVPKEDALTKEEVEYYISENFETFDGIQKGDIVFVKKFIYSSGEIGENHLFVIIDQNNYMPIEYFGMILSPNIKKEYYKYNIKIDKDNKNRLNKDSIVKTDHIYKLNKKDILKKVGKIDNELIKLFIEKYKNYINEINNME